MATDRKATEAASLADGALTRAQEVISLLSARGLSLATCESLTAGLAAGTLASVPGASAVLRGGFICYATELKYSLVGVTPGLDPITEQCANEMALGALNRTDSDLAISLTGVAGPDMQDGHPVGEVWLGLAVKGEDKNSSSAVKLNLAGYDVSELGRQGIRQLSIVQAFDRVIQHVQSI
ncbi:MAG: nicotinamide-nucleotide amidohydrolase family protein [Corynebacterium sp.]|nr:nicotinamide-nucleotide amidohydrolase family protein [Corynebacterium sp.]